MFRTGPIFIHLQQSSYHITVLQGGSSAGKTFSTLQYLLVRAIQEPGLVITIVAQDIPNIRKGALRDFQNILKEAPEAEWYILTYNKSDRIYTFKNGTIIEFVSFEDEQDARGGRRDILFVNECNSISYLVYWQLALRTKQKIILDYNPAVTFWAHTEVIPLENAELVISDHRHNPFLTAQQHATIESIKDPDLWKVYARGMTGILKGIIYPHWEEIPDEEFIWSDGLVWGMDYEGESDKPSGDPTAGCKIAFRPPDSKYDFVIHEVLYGKNMSSDIIESVFVANGYKAGQVIYCDHNKPQITNELRIKRMSAVPAIKGPKLPGILFLRKSRIAYTASSKNIKLELSKYRFLEIEGIQTSIPIDEFDHEMDAIRMGAYSHALRTGKI